MRWNIRTVIHAMICLGMGFAFFFAPLSVSWAQDTGHEAEASAPATGPSNIQSAPAPAECAKIIGLLKKQRREMHRELRAIKREVAALRESLSSPGLREVFGGIGYILGLFGVAFYVYARKSR